MIGARLVRPDTSFFHRYGNLPFGFVLFACRMSAVNQASSLPQPSLLHTNEAKSMK
jgi:hypothetical protein